MMVLDLDESTNSWQYLVGRTLVLEFHHQHEPPHYVTDRGEDLGRSFDEARRAAERLATERLKGKPARRR